MHFSIALMSSSYSTVFWLSQYDQKNMDWNIIQIGIRKLRTRKKKQRKKIKIGKEKKEEGIRKRD